jgi:putative flippase GtrA
MLRSWGCDTGYNAAKIIGGYCDNVAQVMTIPDLKKLLDASLTKFLITGVLNTLVGLGTIYALKWFWQVPDTPANAVGYAVGVTFSLVVNSRWTFQSRESLLSIAPRFLAVILCAYFVNLACVHFCIGVVQLNSYLAHAIGTVPYTAITYVGSRWWVFRRATIATDST